MDGEEGIENLTNFKKAESKVSLSGRKLKRHDSGSTKLDKFLFLLSHVDSDDEDVDPGKFGLYLDPGVIRLEFDDYPDSVIQQEDSPDFLQPRRDSLGRDWIRRSCEELLDMGKTEKQQENLPTLLTTSLSKVTVNWTFYFPILMSPRPSRNQGTMSYTSALLVIY